MPNAGIVTAAATAIVLLATVRETVLAPPSTAIADRGQLDFEGGGGDGGDGRFGTKSLNIELIKSSILNKLGMQQPPEFGDRLPPKVQVLCKHGGSSTVSPSQVSGHESHCVYLPGDGRTDMPSLKTAATSTGGYNVSGGGGGADDDYHVKMQKLIVFAQPHPTTQNPQGHNSSLYFTFSEQTRHYRITKAVLWVYKRRSDVVINNSVVNIDVYRIDPINSHQTSAVSSIKLLINTTEPGWVPIELQRNMSDWFDTVDEVKNLTLTVQASYPNKNTANDKMSFITDAGKNEDITEIPYLEVHTHHCTGTETDGKPSPSSAGRAANTTTATR